jgi:hypothetical protein
MSSGAQLVKIHDDGQHEMTVVVHGLSLSSRYPDFEGLECCVNEAELRGRVYLYFWQSGPSHSFLKCKSRADGLGAALYHSLSRLKGIGSLPITLRQKVTFSAGHGASAAGWNAIARRFSRCTDCRDRQSRPERPNRRSKREKGHACGQG